MARNLAILFGVVFVLVGLLGFVQNPLVGEGALFHTNLVHNLVHSLFGVILLVVASRYPGSSARSLKILGAVYLLIAIIGFITAPQGGMLLGFVEANSADHSLHAGLGIVLIFVGLLVRGEVFREPPMNNGMTSGG